MPWARPDSKDPATLMGAFPVAAAYLLRRSSALTRGVANSAIRTMVMWTMGVPARSGGLPVVLSLRV